MKRIYVRKRGALLAVFIVALLFAAGACRTGRFSGGLPAFSPGTTQTTAFGQVEGFETEDGKVLICKGVPYARSPEGELRWKSPEDPEPWTGILSAKEAGTVAPQLTMDGKIIGGEDCLNLDIYRPNNDRNGLPVLLFIHGGNNQTGMSAAMNGRYLCELTQSVVVSVNYRLGLLGFNNLPALRKGDEKENSGNFAILDIAHSLDWTAENIAAFGGDPQNITLSGFSAGGRDVMAMLISPVLKGKFQKAISLSGGMTLADYDTSAELIAEAVAPLVVEDGLKHSEEDAAAWLMTEGGDVADYLGGLSYERLAPLMGNAGIRMAVFPHLYNDGTVIPKEGFSTKEYNDVPLIMMTGSQEFSLFCRWGFSSISDEAIVAGAPEAQPYLFAKKYGSELYGLFNAEESAVRMFDNYDAPIYTCDFDWGSDPELAGPELARIFGSFHGIWIPFLTHEASGFAALFADSFQSNGAKDLADKFTAYIRNFLWNGNPNGEGLVQWDAWTSPMEGPSQLLLDADAEKATIKMSRDRVSYEDILKAMDADSSLPEDVKMNIIRTVLSGRWFSAGLDEYYGNENPWVMIE